MTVIKFPYQIKALSIFFVIWTFLSGFLLYLSQEDMGLFAQIAMPVFFGGLHILLTFILLKSVFKTYKNSLNVKFKILTICFVLVSFFCAFIFIPSYKIMLGF